MRDILVLTALPWEAALLFHCWRLLLFFQQGEYDSGRFARWTSTRIFRLAPFVTVAIWLLSLATEATLTLTNPQSTNLAVAISLAGGCICAGLGVLKLRRPSKVRLEYTPRLIRLLLLIALISVLLPVLASRLSLGYAEMAGIDLAWSVLLSTLAYGITIILSPLWLILANTTLFPIEAGLRWHYRFSAARKLRRIQPLVVGITGSFGKTSVKEILSQILDQPNRVLATPKSFNTLMGICRVLNTSLQEHHEILIVEMGAYKPGEIAAICRLVRPSVGVVTAVGTQHLERFGTVARIAAAKFELLQSLPHNGLAVLNADDQFTPSFIRELNASRVMTVSSGCNSTADICADAIHTTSAGLMFDIVDRGQGMRVACRTRLIGRHNVLNLLLAFAVGQGLGIDPRTAAARVRRVAPIPHRLQLQRLPSGVNIIDDSYSSNPVGARNALEALVHFEGGRRILVTPGLVELGSEERAANLEIGRLAATMCDRIILVGPTRTAPLREGLLSGGMDPANIEIVQTLKDATARLTIYSQPGDTILFMNDLPDIYSELI